MKLIKTNKKGRKRISRRKVWLGMKVIEFGMNTLVPAIKEAKETRGK